jgi:phage FluMu protein Com
MIRVRCPKCGKLLGLDDSAAGAMGQCPACEETFRIPPAGTDESKLPPASSRPAPAGPTVLEPADEDDEEIADAQAAEDEVEWGRDAPRERKKKRKRRRRQPDMPTPGYLEGREDPELGPLGSVGNLKRIAGFVLVAIGILSICGGWATSMSEAAGKTGSAGICTGIVFGAMFLIAGIFMIFQSD